jgi:hypothetical protein
MRSFDNTEQSDAPGFFVLNHTSRARPTENYLELEFRFESGANAPIFFSLYCFPVDKSSVLCGACLDEIVTPVAFVLRGEDGEVDPARSATLRQLLPLTSQLLENGKSGTFPGLRDPPDPDDGTRKWLLFSYVAGLPDTADDNLVVADAEFQEGVTDTLQLAGRVHDETYAARRDLLDLLRDCTVGSSRTDRAFELMSKASEKAEAARHAFELLRALSGAG